MMTTITENGFCTIELHEGDSILYVKWNGNTNAMSADYYMLNEVIASDCIVDNRVQRVLIDMSDFKFPITDDIQAWHLSNIVERSKTAGLNKVAFVAPNSDNNIISILNNFGGASFANSSQAHVWLMAS